MNIIFNSQIKLLLELKADWCYSNLPTINKVVIIISDKYKQNRFCDIVLAYCNSEENINKYHIISFNLVAYMPFYYMLFFSYDDLE